MNSFKFFIFVFFTVFFSSCVSIKPSTVQLSAEVGARISEMEKLHQMAVQRYFDMEKQKVGDFMKSTWEPLFLKNFLGTSQVLDALQKVSTFSADTRMVLQESIAKYLDDTTEAPKATADLIKALDAARSAEPGVVRTTLQRFVNDNKLDAAVIQVSSVLGTDEPARIIMDFAQAAHDEMDARRKSLMEPIEQARLETSAALSEAYAELIRGQSTITGRLEAAARVSRQQDELLDKLRLNDISKTVTDKLSSITTAVNKALNDANNALQGVDPNNKSKVLSDLKKALEGIKEPSNNSSGNN
jgi:hypothetical protein